MNILLAHSLNFYVGVHGNTLILKCWLPKGTNVTGNGSPHALGDVHAGETGGASAEPCTSLHDGISLAIAVI